MPCIYFIEIKDSKKKATAGVYGYCTGYSREKLRIPSLEEYEKYCTSNCQDGCKVFEFRMKQEKTGSEEEEKT